MLVTPTPLPKKKKGPYVYQISHRMVIRSCFGSLGLPISSNIPYEMLQVKVAHKEKKVGDVRSAACMTTRSCDLRRPRLFDFRVNTIIWVLGPCRYIWVSIYVQIRRAICDRNSQEYNTSCCYTSCMVLNVTSIAV